MCDNNKINLEILGKILILFYYYKVNNTEKQKFFKLITKLQEDLNTYDLKRI